jgi:hypothetical protein
METLAAIWKALSLMPYYPRWAQALFVVSLALVLASAIVFANYYSKAEASKGGKSPSLEVSLSANEEQALGLTLTDPQAGTRGAWAYPLHQQLTYRGMSEAQATTALNSLVEKGFLLSVDVPSYDNVTGKLTNAPAYRVTSSGFAYAAKSTTLSKFQSSYRYTLILSGSEKQNAAFLEQIRTLDSVEAQTRFITSKDPKYSHIMIFSYKPVDETLIRNMAKAFNASVQGFGIEK